MPKRWNEPAGGKTRWHNTGWQSLSPDPLWMLADQGGCLARHGRSAEAAAILEDLNRRRRSEYVDAYHVALLEDALGRRDRAFQELERALEENAYSLLFMAVDPKADAIRTDPRFLHFREKVFRDEPVESIESSVAAGGKRIDAISPASRRCLSVQARAKSARLLLDAKFTTPRLTAWLRPPHHRFTVTPRGAPADTPTKCVLTGPRTTIHSDIYS